MSRHRIRSTIAAATLLLAPAVLRAQAPAAVIRQAQPAVAPGTFVIDPAHSQVGFRVRHLGISNVSGQFQKFSGTFFYDATNPAAARVDVTIDAASVDTHIQRRDDDLRSESFFWVEKHPTITFTAKRIEKVPGTANRFRVPGELTIRGVTKPVVLDAEMGGLLKLQSGASVMALSATTTINRFDYGLMWNRMTEGVANVAPEVQITLDVEARQAK